MLCFFIYSTFSLFKLGIFLQFGVYIVEDCCVFVDVFLIQSNPHQWIALGPDYEYPLIQSIHLSIL